MATVGSKRLRDDEALNTQVTPPSTDVALPQQPNAGAITRKKAKTTPHDDTVLAIRGDATTSSGLDGKAPTDGKPASADLPGNATTVGEEQPGAVLTQNHLDETGVANSQTEVTNPKTGPKRSLRKSAIAAKEKIVAAEAASEDPEAQQLTSPSAQANSGTSSAPQTTTPAPPVHGRSRGRGGDRPPATVATDAAASNAAAAIAVLNQQTIPPPNLAVAPNDPNNPYLVRYGDPNNPYAHIAAQAVMSHNPYLPPTAGYMFASGVAVASYPMLHLASHSAFDVSAAAAAIAAGNHVDGQGTNHPNEEGGNAPASSGNAPAPEAATTDTEGATQAAPQGAPSENAASTSQPTMQPPTGPILMPNPYAGFAFPPGFAAHMPPPEFVPNPNDPHGVHPHPYGHAHLLPPPHHPHLPSGTSHHGIQFTLPLAVTDHTLPSHLDHVIRAPDSLTITYSDVPEGAYLLRADFGEQYPKHLEPPRKTTEMRCLFCKRHYAGVNARGMWRRHVTGKHEFQFDKKPGSATHTGGRQSSKSQPLVPENADEEEAANEDTSMEATMSGMPIDPPNQPDSENPSQEQAGPSMPLNPHMPNLPLGAAESMMGFLTMNGLPVHTHPPLPPPGPNVHMLAGTSIPISSIPPHPQPLNRKRSTANAAGGVGGGNGGGGMVPRVHPLLSKEERMNRARASKRHYAMKRRALEKMKSGGIPKGAILQNGIFILVDGTHIPADPNVTYRDLSGTSANAMDNDGRSKSRTRRGRKKMGDDVDDEDDEEGDESSNVQYQDPNGGAPQGLVSMEPLQGVPVDMDPWGANSAEASGSIPVSGGAGSSPTAASALQSGKLAEVPFIARGLKPPPMHHLEIPSASSSKPPRRTSAIPKKVDDASLPTLVPIVDDSSTRTRRKVGKAASGEAEAGEETGGPSTSQPEHTAVTTLQEAISVPGEDGEERRFCYCNDFEYGNMIGCDNGANCSREWFHLPCTDIQGAIPSKWYCRDCRQTIGNDAELLNDEPNVTTEGGVESEKPRGRRGRPTKLKTAEPEAEPEPEPASPKTPKRRGRPPKAVPASNDKDEPGTSPGAAETREAESEDEIRAAIPNVQAESPGRPRRSTRASAANH